MAEMMRTSNAKMEAKLDALMQLHLSQGATPSESFEAAEIDRSFALHPEVFSSGSSGSSESSGSHSDEDASEEGNPAADKADEVETLATTKLPLTLTLEEDDM